MMVSRREVNLIKMELIEGRELFYENPYKVDVVIGPNPEQLKAKPETCYILKPGESVSVHAKFMYIMVLEEVGGNR